MPAGQALRSPSLQGHGLGSSPPIPGRRAGRGHPTTASGPPALIAGTVRHEAERCWAGRLEGPRGISAHIWTPSPGSQPSHPWSGSLETLWGAPVPMQCNCPILSARAQGHMPERGKQRTAPSTSLVPTSLEHSCVPKSAAGQCAATPLPCTGAPPGTTDRPPGQEPAAGLRALTRQQGILHFCPSPSQWPQKQG